MAAAGAGAGGHNSPPIVLRGEQLRTLLRNSDWVRTIASDLSEENVERILRNGPRNTNEVRIPTNILNANKKRFLEAYAAGRSLGTVYPGGIMLQGLRETTGEAGITEPSDYFMMPKQNAENRFKALANSGMLHVVSARPVKAKLATPIKHNQEYSANSNNSETNSGNKEDVNLGETTDPVTGKNLRNLLIKHGLGPKPYGKTKGKKGGKRRGTRRRHR